MLPDALPPSETEMEARFLHLLDHLLISVKPSLRNKFVRLLAEDRTVSSYKDMSNRDVCAGWDVCVVYLNTVCMNGSFSSIRVNS